jgi:hypothetical protein
MSKVEGSGFRIQGSGMQNYGSMVYDQWCRVEDYDFMVRS